MSLEFVNLLDLLTPNGNLVLRVAMGADQLTPHFRVHQVAHLTPRVHRGLLA